jgi:uncharacterized YccA/Bax inhibitor family protein
MPQLMRTSNPALTEKAFREYEAERFGGGGFGGSVVERMTLNGTVNKTGILLVCAFLTAGWTWFQFMATQDVSTVAPWMMVGVIGGFITAMVTIFKQSWAPVTAPLYALLEGLALGSISAFFEKHYPGIAIEAVGLTFGTLFTLLIAYRTGLIKVTQKFRLGVIAATGGIAVFYLLQMVLGMFHVQLFYGANGVNGSGLIGIGFSLVVVVVAALNLVLDFDFIESGVRAGAPKYMEWYGAFGIMVTLVWLYLEILRLLSKLSRRN